MRVERSEPTRVVIGDGDAESRAAVRGTLEASGMVVCGEGADVDTVVEVVCDERPDVALLAVRMPGNGLRAVAAIATAAPGVAIVMHTNSIDPDDLFAALRLGAVGYLPKDTDPERLPHVLRSVLAGEPALPRALVGRLIDELRRRDSLELRLAGDRAVRLTDRQWEVVDLLRRGLSTPEIAERMFISEVTVRTHISGVLRTLRVRDRAEALRILEEVEESGADPASA